MLALGVAVSGTCLSHLPAAVGDGGSVNVAAEIRSPLQVTGWEPGGAVAIRDPKTNRVVAMALVIEGESCGQGDTGTMPMKQGQNRCQGTGWPFPADARDCAADLQ